MAQKIHSSEICSFYRAGTQREKELNFMNIVI